MPDSAAVWSAVAAIFSAVAGGAAAVAAFRSSATAKEAHAQSVRAEHARLFRELESLVGHSEVECKRATKACELLEPHLNAAANMMGALHGGGHQLVLARLNDYRATVTQISTEMAGFRQRIPNLRIAKAEDVSEPLPRIEASLVTIRGIREEVERWHGEVEASRLEFIRQRDR